MIQSHLVALAAVATLVGVAVAASRLRAAAGARAVLAAAGGTGPLLGRTGRPHVLYFTTPTCAVCRTHQEPALRRLEGIEVRKVDAIENPELAKRYHVYTVPTTVVLGSDGVPVAVNYGYAPAEKLRRQLGEAAAPALAS